MERTGVVDLVGLESLAYAEYYLLLTDNSALRSLRALSSFNRASGILIADNPVLPTCEADWLAARTTGASIDVYGNDDAGVCPP